MTELSIYSLNTFRFLFPTFWATSVVTCINVYNCYIFFMVFSFYYYKCPSLALVILFVLFSSHFCAINVTISRIFMVVLYMLYHFPYRNLFIPLNLMFLPINSMYLDCFYSVLHALPFLLFCFLYRAPSRKGTAVQGRPPEN